MIDFLHTLHFPTIGLACLRGILLVWEYVEWIGLCVAAGMLGGYVMKCHHESELWRQKTVSHTCG